jgi:hypothetical protein
VREGFRLRCPTWLTFTLRSLLELSVLVFLPLPIDLLSLSRPFCVFFAPCSLVPPPPSRSPSLTRTRPWSMSRSMVTSPSVQRKKEAPPQETDTDGAIVETERSRSMTVLPEKLTPEQHRPILQPRRWWSEAARIFLHQILAVSRERSRRVYSSSSSTAEKVSSRTKSREQPSWTLLHPHQV